MYWLRILSKYLQTQNILAPTVLIGLFANGVNVLWNWLFMVKGEFGLAGSAWSTVLTAVTQFILVLLYMLSYQKDKMLECT
jgi:Na+-driven multidrug efflux pump